MSALQPGDEAALVPVAVADVANDGQYAMRLDPSVNPASYLSAVAEGTVEVRDRRARVVEHVASTDAADHLVAAAR